MSEKKEDVKKAPETEEQQYSLNDDRRVKVLSPGALVAQRFFRNRVAVTGLVILAFMFLFSFVGGVISPYKEDQIFYRTEAQNQQYAGVTENTDFRYSVADGQSFDSVCQAQFLLATIQGNDTFTARDTEYTYAEMGEDFYAIYADGGNTLVAFAAYDIVYNSNGNEALPFDLQYNILLAVTSNQNSFTLDGHRVHGGREQHRLCRRGRGGLRHPVCGPGHHVRRGADPFLPGGAAGRH